MQALVLKYKIFYVVSLVYCIFPHNLHCKKYNDLTIFITIINLMSIDFDIRPNLLLYCCLVTFKIKYDLRYVEYNYSFIFKGEKNPNIDKKSSPAHLICLNQALGYIELDSWPSKTWPGPATQYKRLKAQYVDNQSSTLLTPNTEVAKIQSNLISLFPHLGFSYFCLHVMHVFV